MYLKRSAGALAAALTLGFASSGVASDSVFAIGPDGVAPYTDLLQLDTSGHIQQYGTVGFAVSGGLAPLTTPLTSIAFDNGNLFAVGPDSTPPYTDLYELDTSGHIQQYGAVGFAVAGGLAPLTTPLSAIAFDSASPAPEPAAWALMLVGLASMGASVRARRTRTRQGGIARGTK